MGRTKVLEHLQNMLVVASRTEPVLSEIFETAHNLTFKDQRDDQPYNQCERLLRDALKPEDKVFRRSNIQQAFNKWTEGLAFEIPKEDLNALPAKIVSVHANIFNYVGKTAELAATLPNNAQGMECLAALTAVRKELEGYDAIIESMQAAAVEAVEAYRFAATMYRTMGPFFRTLLANPSDDDVAEIHALAMDATGLDFGDQSKEIVISLITPAKHRYCRLEKEIKKQIGRLSGLHREARRS